MLAPLQWKMSVPLLLAEFIMIYQLIADIPAEFTLAQTTAEIQRRVEETLNTYFEQDSDEDEDMERVQEQATRYSTPYELMSMVHMELWNEIVVDAIKCPPTLNKKFISEGSRLLQEETVFTKWLVLFGKKPKFKTTLGLRIFPNGKFWILSIKWLK